MREFNELFQEEDTLKESFINWKKYTHILKVPNFKYEIKELVKEHTLIHNLKLDKLSGHTNEFILAEYGLYGLIQNKLAENLKSYLEYNLSGFPLKIAQGLIKSLLEQVAVMHHNDFYHGDLKPANICFDHGEKIIFLGKTNCMMMYDYVLNFKMENLD